MTSLASLALLASLLGLALHQDLATRRIPNRVVLAGLASGLLCQALLPAGAGLFMTPAGALGWQAALLGLLAGGGALLPLYLLGTMGAGDVKLMAMAGVFFGPWQAAGAVLLTVLCGGLLALCAASTQHLWPQVWRNLRLMLLVGVAGRGCGLRVDDLASCGRLPYAAAISCGCMLQILLARFTAWPLA